MFMRTDELAKKDNEIAALRTDRAMAMSMLEDAEARVSRQNVEIATLRYELLAEKTARADADKTIMRIKEELRLADLTVEAWVENYDTIGKREAALKERYRSALDNTDKALEELSIAITKCVNLDDENRKLKVSLKEARELSTSNWGYREEVQRLKEALRDLCHAVCNQDYYNDKILDSASQILKEDV